MSRDVPILDLDVPLVEQLRGEGELLARGSFDLDEERAREKLQSFQLASPHHYVLELLSCASLMGARRVNYSISRRKVSMDFDGDVFAKSELEGIYSAAFDRSLEPRRRAQRHLAVALSAAEGIVLSSLVIESGYEDHARLTITPGEPDVVDDPGRVSNPGTTVTVRERTTWKKFLSMGANQTPEIEILKEHAGYSRIGVWVNGECVSFGMRLPEARYDLLTFVRTPAEYGKIGVVYSDSQATHRAGVTKVWLLQNGVFVSRHSLSWPYGPVDMIIDSRRLTKNLSQSAFVEDEAWHQLYDDVLEEALCWLMHNRVRMAYEAPGVAVSGFTSGHVRGWMDLVMRGALERAAGRRREGKVVGEHMRALVEHAEHRPLISLRADGGGAPRSLASLGLGRREARAPRFEGGARAGRDVFEEGAPDLELVEDYLGRDAVDAKTGSTRGRALPWNRTDEPEVEEDEVVAPVEVTIGLREGGEPELGEADELELPELQLGAFYLGEREGGLDEGVGVVLDEVAASGEELEVYASERAEREDLEGWLLALLAPATRAAMAWTQPSGVLIERGARVGARLRLGKLVLDAALPELAGVWGEGELDALEDLEGAERVVCGVEQVVPLARRVLSELLARTRLGRAARLAAQRALVDALIAQAYPSVDAEGDGEREMSELHQEVGV